MTRIVIFNDVWCTGGVESLYANLFKYFDFTEFEIILVVGQKETDVFDDLLDEKTIQMVVLNEFVIGNPIKRDLYTIGQLGKTLKCLSPDIVHINVCNAIGFYYAKIAKKYTDAKTIIHAHSTCIQNDKFKIKALIHQFLGNFEKYSDENIACSESAGNFMFKTRYDVLNNGIDTTRFKYSKKKREEYREKFGYKDNDYVLGHVGRFSDVKNHRFIIDVFFELRNESDKYKLLLIGDGELKKEIEEYAKIKNVHESVTFIGAVNNVHDYMQAMDLFILPSKFEGFGLVCVEAQACGLPIIVSEGVPDEINISKKVNYLPVDKVFLWKKLILDFPLMDKSTNMVDVNNTNFDIKCSAKKLENIYSKLMRINSEN